MPLLIEEKIPKELFRADGKRLDGRAVDDIRYFSCKIGVLKNAQGSAYVEHGGNKIYAAVYGPREVHPKHMARSDRGIVWQLSVFLNENRRHQIVEKLKSQK